MDVLYIQARYIYYSYMHDDYNNNIYVVLHIMILHDNNDDIMINILLR